MAEFESSPENYPWVEHDPFLSNFERYAQEINATKYDGEADIENNRLRLAASFDDLLGQLDITDVEALNIALEVLPPADLSFMETVARYKLAPLMLLDQLRPDCPLPLEHLAPQRIKEIFNLALEDSKTLHMRCISSKKPANELDCEQYIRCPMRTARKIGGSLYSLLVIQEHLQRDEPEPRYWTDPTANAQQLYRSLAHNLVILPFEMEAMRNHAQRYVNEQILSLSPPETPRLNDESSDS